MASGHCLLAKDGAWEAVMSEHEYLHKNTFFPDFHSLLNSWGSKGDS